MNSSVIILNNVTKTFHVNLNSYLEELKVLNRVSFTVKKGEMLGIVGSNGSGKTTLLRTIAGIYLPDSGSVNIHGKLAPLLQLGTGFHNELDVEENIAMYGMILGLSKSEIKSKMNEIIEFSDLKKFSKMKLKNFSTGMRMRLAFSIAMQIDPDIILIDEILSVGDSNFRKKSLNAIISFKDKGKTILFSSHNLSWISKFCDRAILLDKGNLIMIDQPKEVITKYQQIMSSNVPKN